MGTRSRIGILEPDGTVTSIYCHWDGYVAHHGPILQGHYTTEEKVRALMTLGDISILGEELGVKHDFRHCPAGVCNAYGRDRGEKGSDAINDTAATFVSYHIYAYLFDPMTSSWGYFDTGKSSPLIDAINANRSNSSNWS